MAGAGLVIALLLALLAQDPARLQAEMDVDVDEVPAGGEVVLTVRARSGSTDPIRIMLPPLAGLELVARSERSDVSAGTAVGRSTVLELRLRGSTPGRWRVGPAKVHQGNQDVVASAIEIEVTGSSSASTTSAASVSANVQRLLAHSRPPRSADEASVSIILSSASAYVGEQVDVVTAAWFPRELRLQLRRPPTVQTPSIDGVYAFPQRSPSGIAASRQVDGRWFDLFVVHQIVFPLTPGQLRVPSATLHYSVPLAFQFFSQEERYAVRSEPGKLEVKPLPVAGRAATFSGGVGRGLSLERNLTPRAGRAGEPFAMEVVLHGEGNVAIWPPPTIEWPAHLRAYNERTTDKIEINAGRLGGTKTFRYLVVPDSARTAGLPALVYDYFDPVSASYTSARAPAVTYLVLPAANVSVSRASPAPLKPATGPALARRLLDGTPRWALLVGVLLPPLVALARSIPRRRKSGVVRTSSKGDPLAHAEREFATALAALVPRVATLQGYRLETAMRAAGLDSELAHRVVELRERVRVSRYGPGGEVDLQQLLGELRAVVAQLQGVRSAGRIRRTVGAAVGVLALASAPSIGAQSIPPEQLYERGALSAAASAFEQRVALEPFVPAHWFNLGATDFRMGRAGEALASWSKAERLAPRDVVIRRALRLVPIPDARSARALYVPPVTPDELFVAAAALWVLGWLGYALTRRQRWAVAIIGALIVAAGGGALTLWYQRPIAVVTAENSLALSPHELAPAVSTVQVGSVVSVLRREPGWAMVRDGGGKIGWLPSSTIERL